MTYSDSRPLNTAKPSTAKPDIAWTPDEDFTGWPCVFEMLVNAALFWMAQFSVKRGPKTRGMLNLVLAVLLALHKGTQAEKAAFLKRLVARHTVRQVRIHARYRAWRQRKCWMWGGGLRAGTLAVLPDVFAGTRDGLSFDALIPD